MLSSHPPACRHAFIFVPEMCIREVTHSCGHTCRETIEPLDLSLEMEPISVSQRCWRCLGERPRPNISNYGDYRIEFTGYLEAPSETPSETGTSPNVPAPATSSRTKSNSSHALQSLFVPVFDARDLPNQSPYSAYSSAPESDADRRQTFSPSPTPGPRPGTRSRTANRYAQVIDGTLYSSHEDPGVPVPDIQSNPRGLNPVPSTEEAIDVAATYNDDTR